MRFHWLRARALVHATEDEPRVQATLLWLAAQDGDPKAYARIQRQRTKGHYGNEILVLETTLKKRDAEAALARILGDEGVRQAVADSLLRRLDEENVLHMRLDKQAAVQRRLALGEGSDAVVVTAKAVHAKDETPAKSWAAFLRADERRTVEDAPPI